MACLTARLLFALAIAIVAPGGKSHAASTRIVYTSDDSLTGGAVCNTNALNQFVNSVLALNPRPQIVIHGGDMINTPTNADGFNCFRMFTNIVDRLVTNGIPFYSAVGNHDPSGGVYVPDWYAKWTNAFYYFPTNGPAQWSKLAYYVDVGSCRLVFLDSITAGTNSPGMPIAAKVDPIERTWLRSVIGTNSPAEFDCAITHLPAYITNPTDESLADNPTDGDDFLQALVDAKTSVFFCGHCHNPSRRMIDARYNAKWIRTIPQVMDVMGSPSDGGGNTNYPPPEFWADSTAENTNTFTVLDLDPVAMTGTGTTYMVIGPTLLDQFTVMGKHYSTFQLTVGSSFGGAVPQAGTWTFGHNAALICAITNSPILNNTTQYMCSGWTGTGCVPATGTGTNTGSFTLTNDSTIVWNWQTNYWLHTVTIGSGTVNVADGWYQQSTSVTVTATAATNYFFIGWAGTTNGCTISSNRITVPMTGPGAITAVFSGGNRALTVASAYGTAQPPVGSDLFTYGSTVTCYMAGSPVLNGSTTQYTCLGWTGTGSAPPSGTGTNTGSFTLTNDSSIVWNWQTNYWLHAAANGSGTVNVADAWYQKGTGVTITATAMPNYFFMGWTGTTNGCAISSNQITVPINGPESITAMFLGPSMRIVAISDPQGSSTNLYVNTNTLNTIINSILALNPRPAVVTVGGDMTYAPVNIDSPYDYKAFTNLMNRLVTNGIPYYCAIGNHDTRDLGTAWYSDFCAAFSNPTNGPTQWLNLAYYVDVGNARLVFVDSITGGTNWLYDGDSSNGDSVDMVDPIETLWLRSVIGTNSPKTFDFVITHVPAYVMAESHRTDGQYLNPAQRDAFVQALVDARLSALLVAHDHREARQMLDRRYNANWICTIPSLISDAGGGLYTPLLLPANPPDQNQPAPDFDYYTGFGFIVLDLDSSSRTGTASIYTADGSNLLDQVTIQSKLNRESIFIASDNGICQPPQGTNILTHGLILSASVTNSPLLYGTTQYVCTGWSGTGSVPVSGSGTNTGPFTLTNSSTVAWSWRTNYWLHTVAVGSGVVNIADGWYQQSTSITIMATAMTNYIFLGWSGTTNGCAISSNQITVPMNGPGSITATFSGGNRTLTVASLYGTAQPPVGSDLFIYCSTVTCYMAGSPVLNGSTTQYTCTGWTGTGNVPPSGAGTNTPPFTFTSDSSITWSWLTRYWLHAASSGSGKVDVADAWYSPGTSVVITATASNNYHLASWSGTTNGCTMSSNQITVPMDAARTITATFAINQFTLTVTSVIGTAVPAPGVYTNDYGTILTCALTNSPVTGVGTQYVCTGWIGAGSVPPTGPATNTGPFAITNTSSIAWNWSTNYWLTASASSNGTINATNNWYLCGTSVTVTATASNNYHLASWSGTTNGCTVSSNQITVPMDATRTITANFTIDRYTLTVTSAHGIALPATGVSTNDYGTILTCALTNSPITSGGTQYVCTGWTGAGSVLPSGSGTNTGPFTITSTSSITWNWSTNYWLTASAASNGTINVTNNWYIYGTSVTITATASNNYHLASWTGTTNGCTMSSNQIIVPMDAARTITATFAINEFTLTVTSAIGIAVPAPGVYTNDYGTILTCALTNSPVTSGGTQYVCTGWVGGGNVPPAGPGTNTGPFTITNTSSITWNWSTNYWLIASAASNGTINVTNNWYIYGTSVTITATASNNYHLASWSGTTNGCTISSNQITVPMDAARTITATFAINQFTLTVTSAIGTALPAPGVYTNDYGTILACALTNSPVASGGTQYVCTGWTGTGSAPGAGAQTNTGPFAITNNSSVQWNWTTNYWLDTQVSGSGSVDVAAAWISSGSNVLITATPATNCHFLGWSGDTGSCTIAGAQIAVLVTCPKLIIADFAADAPPNLADFNYNMKIRFAGNATGETLTNFPALVVLNESLTCYSWGIQTNLSYKQFASANGADLRFTDASTNVIRYEVENWNTNGDSFIWVQVPLLAGTNTCIWAWWGSTNDTWQPAYTTNGDAWSSDYLGVWHLRETQAGTNNPGVYRDSTARGNNGKDNISATGKTGVVYYGQQFNGTNDFIQLESLPIPTNPPLGSSNFTLSVWLQRTGTGVTASSGNGGVVAEPLICKGRAEYDGDRRDLNYFFGVNGTSLVLTADIEEGVGGTNLGLNHPVSGITPVPSNTWINAAVTYDGTWKLYFNGNLEAQANIGMPPRWDSIQPASIGAALDSSNNAAGAFCGCLDEARIAKTAHSAGWIRDSYLTIQSNNTFTVYTPDPHDLALHYHSLSIVSAYGGAVPPAGMTNYLHGTVLSPQITNSPVLDGATQYLCTGWIGIGSVPSAGYGTNTGSFVLTNDSTITWLWNTNYWLHTAASGSGTVDVADGWFSLGSNVLITATPLPYYHFAAWTGDTNGCIIATNTVTAWMSNPRQITAGFATNFAPLGTPEWWLAAYGLTNGPFSVVEANDSDSDGLANWQEWIAGTDPTNAASVLKLTDLSATSNSRVALTFITVPAKTYEVMRSMNLCSNDWLVVDYATNQTDSLVSGAVTATVNSITIYVDSAGIKSGAYRIKVK